MEVISQWFFNLLSNQAKKVKVKEYWHAWLGLTWNVQDPLPTLG